MQSGASSASVPVEQDRQPSDDQPQICYLGRFTYRAGNGIRGGRPELRSPVESAQNDCLRSSIFNYRSLKGTHFAKTDIEAITTRTTGHSKIMPFGSIGIESRSAVGYGSANGCKASYSDCQQDGRVYQATWCQGSSAERSHRDDNPIIRVTMHPTCFWDRKREREREKRRGKGTGKLAVEEGLSTFLPR